MSIRFVLGFVCLLGLLGESLCAQEQRLVEQRAEALAEARFSLVEAVLRANRAVPGDVAAARFEVRPGSPSRSVYVVEILAGRGLTRVEVDAVTGQVGKERSIRPEAPKLTLPPGPKAAPRLLDLAKVPVGRIPAGWKTTETAGAGKPAFWRVEEEAPEGGRILRLVETHNRGETCNLLLSARNAPANLELAVRLRADSGVEAQGGGLVWRARDEGNHYLARWDPLQGNVRVYKVTGGRRTLLQTQPVEGAAGQWRELKVIARGPAMRILFDGKPLLELEDETFLEPGKIGLWTAADAASSFGDVPTN